MTGIPFLRGILPSILLFGLNACAIFQSGSEGSSDRVITSKLDTSRYFARNVSIVRGFDRVSTMNVATSFSWWDSNGVLRELNQNFGNVLVLYFWNTSSPLSMSTSQELLAAKQALKDSDVVFVGITLKEKSFDSTTVWHVQSIADSLGMTFQHVIGNSELSYSYSGIDVLPTVVIVNRYAKIHERLLGNQKSPAIIEAVRKALIYKPLR